MNRRMFAATATLLTVVIATGIGTIAADLGWHSSVTNQPLGPPTPYKLTDQFGQSWESTDLTALQLHIFRRNRWEPARWNPAVRPTP